LCCALEIKINHVSFPEFLVFTWGDSQIKEQLPPSEISSVIVLGIICFRKEFLEEGPFLSSVLKTK
jgi:hypothetical protein